MATKKKSMHIGIIIRTYNEEKFLDEALHSIAEQDLEGMTANVVIVDSGSTDSTLDIAQKHNCQIEHIKKEDFTFGLSLNSGCAAAECDILVFLSGHCVPAANTWLANLVAPLKSGEASYSYGRQIGRSGYTKYSEELLLKKYFPKNSNFKQADFFCNNANAALLKSVWERWKFDEKLTGLEDMALAKRIQMEGHHIAYCADSPVEHIHEETWKQVKTRYEREAIALQAIMPEVHIYLFDFLRYTISGILLDFSTAVREKSFLRHAWSIVAFRVMQYWGSYRGNNDNKRLSKARREKYFYPR